MENSVVPVSQQLINHIRQRERLLDKDFMKYQRQINVCDSMKDAFGLTGECKEYFKGIIERLYTYTLPYQYTKRLHEMEHEIDLNGALGLPPESISFLYLKMRNSNSNLMPTENRLPEYVEYAVQDSGYNPMSIKNDIKILLLNFSEFDPATRETQKVTHDSCILDQVDALDIKIMELLGLPDTSITCQCETENPRKYKLIISYNGIQFGNSVTIGSPSTFTNNDNNYFLGNKTKNDAITKLYTEKAKSLDDEVLKYAIAKLWGDKGQVIGTLIYMIRNDIMNDQVCMFTTDNVVSMLCRILGISCCVQDHGEEEKEGKEETKLSRCRVKYYACKQDATTLFKAQIKNEYERYIEHNNRVIFQINAALAIRRVQVGSEEVVIPVEKNNIQSFFEQITTTIQGENAKVLDMYNSLVNEEKEYNTKFNEFKLFSNERKAFFIISPVKDSYKALQSVRRLFPGNIENDLIHATKTTFGAYLYTLAKSDKQYSKVFYRRPRAQGGGGDALEHINNKDISIVTDTFLFYAKEAIVNINENLDKFNDYIDNIYTQEGVYTPLTPMEEGEGGRIVNTQEGVDTPLTPMEEGEAQQIEVITGKKRVRGEGGEEEGSEGTQGHVPIQLFVHAGGGTKELYEDIKNLLEEDSTVKGDLILDKYVGLLEARGMDEYDILYILYPLFTYIGETPYNKDVIEYLIIYICLNPHTFDIYNFEELQEQYYKFIENQGANQSEGQGATRPSEGQGATRPSEGQGGATRPSEGQGGATYGGAYKRKTRKIHRKLKGILKTRNKKRNIRKTLRGHKRNTRK